MPKNETALVNNIKKAILREYPEAWIFKVAGGKFQSTGIPDLLICIDGLLFAFEVKHRKSGESEAHARARTSPIQTLVMAKELGRAGAVTGTVLSSDEVLEKIRGRLSNGRK